MAKDLLTLFERRNAAIADCGSAKETIAVNGRNPADPASHDHVPAFEAEFRYFGGHL